MLDGRQSSGRVRDDNGSDGARQQHREANKYTCAALMLCLPILLMSQHDTRAHRCESEGLQVHAPQLQTSRASARRDLTLCCVLARSRGCAHLSWWRQLRVRQCALLLQPRSELTRAPQVPGRRS